MRIQISHLTKTFWRGARALDDLTLTVPTGMFGLLGPNGAGKTTLMRVLAGVLHPSNGRVLIGDHDIATRTGRSSIQRTLGYLPQDLGVYPDLTAREFLDYIGLLKGNARYLSIAAARGVGDEGDLIVDGGGCLLGGVAFSGI
jgi:ABC-type multidrug transport system ATPase subunit